MLNSTVGLIFIEAALEHNRANTVQTSVGRSQASKKSITLIDVHKTGVRFT